MSCHLKSVVQLPLLTYPNNLALTLNLIIFYCRDQIDLTCEILKRILCTIPISHALNKYEDLFLQGLAHSENRVKELILQEV
jgi:hypothetical protein